MPQPAEWQAIGDDPEKFAALVKAANRQSIKIRRDREHLLLICYGKSLDTNFRIRCRQSASIRTGRTRLVLPRLSFSAEFNKSSIRYVFVTEKS
jgi:hypothetical protein